jgi:DeoR family ulaG and ulaABCDEF operon transcriptional repressor
MEIFLDTDKRYELIREYLQNSPFASVRDCAVRLGVSVATVRRDIDKLDKLGLVRKVYGGVSAIDGAAAHGVFARTYAERSGISVEAKRAIAAEAALMVQDGDAVIVNGGSTCFRLGEKLASRNIRLCTNSMPLAAMLGEVGSCALTVLGGELHREPGIFRVAQGARFYASKFFLSGQGVDDRGLLESHPLLVEAASHFAECTDRIVALVDSSKFAVGARNLSLPWSRIDTLVTDTGLAPENRAMLEARGVEVRIAEARLDAQ